MDFDADVVYLDPSKKRIDMGKSGKLMGGGEDGVGVVDRARPSWGHPF